MIKMIISDIDGTLVKDDKSISENTKKTILNWIASGNPFAIATGRMHGAGRIITQKLDYDGFLISCNGAVVKHLQTGAVIQAIEIPKQAIFQVVAICKKHDAYFHLYNSESIFAEKREHLALKYAQGMDALPPSYRFKVEFLDDVTHIIADTPIYKIGLYSEIPEVFKRVMDEINALGTLETCKSLETSFDCMAKGVSKATGIQALCDHFGLSREHVIAFGDNENDADMIRYSGIGVAMENATDALKKEADYVTLSNEEDGIVFALKHFQLI